MSDGIKILTQNKKAGFDYHILESFEAGIVLKGTELKPLRAAQVQLKDSFIDVLNDELYLIVPTSVSTIKVVTIIMRLNENESC